MTDFIKSWRSAADKAAYIALQNSIPAAHGVNDPNSSHYLKSETYTKIETNSLLSTKENAFGTGTTLQYLRGDKTWQTLNTSVVPELTNLYWTQVRFNLAFALKTTTDLAEGTNLYWTQARFDSAFAAKTTTNLAEGTNLYFTTARARESLSASSPLIYDNKTGVFGLGYNSTNLKLSFNSLNTIQNIDSTASPNFVNVNLSGLVLSTGTGNNTFAGNIVHSGSKSLYNNFTSGWTGSGWRLDYGVTAVNQSSLEVDNLRVRGTMNVYELIINQIRATNGSFFISSTAKVESFDDSDPYNQTINFEDPDNFGYCPFLNNDILLVQRVQLDSTTIVKKIYLTVISVSGTEIQYEYLGTPVGTLSAGDTVVRIGNSINAARQGSVYLTSDDTNSPFMDIKDGVNSYTAWNDTSTIKTRLGKLTGITDSNFGTLSGYGLYAANAYLKGGIWATFGNIAGWNITDQYLYKLGTGTPTASPARGLIFNSGGVTSTASIGVYGSTWQKAAYMYYNSDTDWGIKGYNNSNNLVFILGYTNQIAGWSFDNTKLTVGSASNGISLNTSSSPFITGASAKGFEVYDSANPKLFIGKKDGNFIDWNVTTADTITIKGDVIGSRFSTTATNPFDGSNGTYASLHHVGGIPTLFMERYTDANNNCIARVGTSNAGAVGQIYLYEISGGTTLGTVKIGIGSTALSAYMTLDGLNVRRNHPRGITLPASNLQEGDTFYKSDTKKWYMYDTSDGWVLLN